MHALYTTHSDLLDITWLLRHPHVIEAFHIALVKAPLDAKPTAFALLARLCTLDCVRSKGFLPAPSSLLPHAKSSAYCSKCKQDNLFGHMENTITNGLQVSCPCSCSTCCSLAGIHLSINQSFHQPMNLTLWDITTWLRTEYCTSQQANAKLNASLHDSKNHVVLPGNLEPLFCW